MSLAELANNPRNRMDLTTGSMWDNIQAHPGACLPSTIRLFHTPIGEGGKSLKDTSMSIACALPAPEQFEINRIIFSFPKTLLLEDVYLFCEEYVFVFQLGQKNYIQTGLMSLPMRTLHPRAPIHTCNYCNAVFANQWACPGCGAKEFHLVGMTEGEESGKDLMCFVLELLYPLPILQQQYFEARFEASRGICLKPSISGGQGLRVWCHLEGTHARAVQ